MFRRSPTIYFITKLHLLLQISPNNYVYTQECLQGYLDTKFSFFEKIIFVTTFIEFLQRRNLEMEEDLSLVILNIIFFKRRTSSMIIKKIMKGG